MVSVLGPYLARLAQAGEVVFDADRGLSGGDFLAQMERQQHLLMSACVTQQDILALQVGKSLSDWKALLAAINLGIPVVVHQAKQRLPDWVSVRFDVAAERLTRLRPAHAHCLPEPMLATFSSGSTGQPKAIWHRVQNFIESANACNQLLPLSVSDRSLVSLPLHHVGGLGTVFRALTAASQLVFSGPADSLEALKVQGISRLSLVPTQLYRLLEQGVAPGQLAVLLGGAPIPESLLQRARKQGWRIHRSYGLSEMASQVITETADDYWQLLPHAEVTVVGGELYVNGISLFTGYGDPFQLRRPLTTRGFATGDLASWQGNRFLFTGRKDNTFISGGENVQPEAIEQRFIDEFKFSQCVVVGRHDDEWGQRCVLCIPATSKVSCQTLSLFAQQLMPHERPVQYYLLPQTGQLKVSRPLITEMVTRNDLEEVS
ncbi:AMP-binding protein [Reinekea marinisedimentorum]|uniref:O-succinylbenzoic acid--CoA ligase n=1 Tax=Reinekea marinisedimentorum TaxID=230495 RepID=A0A4R3I6M9_9GAMM|nr:AMP-binding protein [Reinekea marinisedimentorum]TCS39729.1 O-succinylbenzoic acid--CoA ligase [Reinekea marinisedimentorum]